MLSDNAYQARHPFDAIKRNPELLILRKIKKRETGKKRGRRY
jgi:hypothetical protein